MERGRRAFRESLGYGEITLRIAHHEPLINEALGARHADLVTVLDAIDPVLHRRALSDDRLPALLLGRP